MSPADRDGDTSTPVRRLREAVSRLAGQTRGRPRTGLTHQDADDATGTAGTDDAVGFDPLPLLRTLDLAGARVVVIGQVAGIMHGSAELTGDLDLLWDGDTAQAGLLAAAFTQASARLTNDDGVPVPCDFTIRYLSRQDLILMRQAAGRAKDLRRASELQALRCLRDSNVEEVAYAADPVSHRGPFPPHKPDPPR